tara:strand:+ start:931 stop:2136 length:1206 start_codon:yes stop_codon:yes gene_type:complete
MGLITETNEQYYAGAQKFLSIAAATQSFTTTFDTGLVFGSFNPLETGYALNNFKLYTAAPGVLAYTELITTYTVIGNTISIPNLAANTSVVVQLKSLTGGNYGLRDAFGSAVEDNYDDYSYIKLNEVINNFMVAYIGAGKLIPSAKRTDIIFFAKRAMQEFSYDTLKSIKSQELNISPSLSIIIPQDYVNYTNISFIDASGVKRPIYPANNLTTNPYENPIQDNRGVPTQDNFGENLEGTSLTEARWAAADDNLLNGEANNLRQIDMAYDGYDFSRGIGQGQLYGLDPQYSQINGWFTINHREGKMSFSSNLANALVVLEYVSDGLAYDLETKVPKMAEEAMYAYINHAIMATRANQPEYVINRLSREKTAKLRNAKIRLSNIKLNEIVQVMRGKSKWIKS